MFETTNQLFLPVIFHCQLQNMCSAVVPRLLSIPWDFRATWLLGAGQIIFSWL